MCLQIESSQFGPGEGQAAWREQRALREVPLDPFTKILPPPLLPSCPTQPSSPVPPVIWTAQRVGISENEATLLPFPQVLAGLKIADLGTGRTQATQAKNSSHHLPGYI